MRASPRITSVEVTTFEYTLPDLGTDYNTFNLVYEPGTRLARRGHVVSIRTDQGIAGEYPGVGGPTLAQVQMVAGYLIGKDALQREAIYNDVKRGLRHGWASEFCTGWWTRPWCSVIPWERGDSHGSFRRRM
jgi:L-alanine-DL-glutamate epimerase-like enolase superfamily enzyme